jgi:glycosidase
MTARLLALLSIVALSACDSRSGTTSSDSAAAGIANARPSTDTSAYPAWARDAVSYEVNVRQYTPQGTFAAFEAHLPRLQKLGIDMRWLMPVQPIGVKERKGSLGSYYSIRDYTAINPEFGSEDDFRQLVDPAHALGMNVILDWVANYTSHDHEWIASHPDFHERRKDGTVLNSRDNEGRGTDWTDVAELDCANPAMRSAMIGEMRWWLDTMGIDGFRCDVAGGVPTDFRVAARTDLRTSRPDLFMLAEAESPQIHAAFD